MRFLAAVFLLMFLAACSAPSDPEGRPNYCDMDNMICPDGSVVMRTGPDCEFVCPEAAKDECGYTIDNRQYWHHDLRECASSVPKCDAGWTKFSDKCGCGCQKS